MCKACQTATPHLVLCGAGASSTTEEAASRAADGDTTLIESLPIVEWLDWKFPDSGTRILPEDLTARYKARRARACSGAVASKASEDFELSLSPFDFIIVGIARQSVQEDW